jgi:hypothetical protein
MGSIVLFLQCSTRARTGTHTYRFWKTFFGHAAADWETLGGIRWTGATLPLSAANSPHQKVAGGS